MNLSFLFDHYYVKELFQKNGYQLDKSEITMFGYRNINWMEDEWHDVLGMIHGEKVIAVTGTTKPGKSPLSREDVNKDGVFILAPGYYKNCWKKGKHKGKYDALVQAGPGIFKGWRDNDKDGNFDITSVLWDNVSGLNFHTTRWDKNVFRVGDFSEGCQVVHVASEYDLIMKYILESKQELFSYALFQQ